MEIKTSIVSLIGPGHLSNNSPNQDAVLRRIRRQDWLVVVCDGMGSRKHSDKGSKLCCLAVLQATKYHSMDINIKDFILSVGEYWHSLLKQSHLKSKDACTTCLVAWGDYDGNTRLFQLGDGAIFYQTDQFGIVQPPDENNFSNETNALGISSSWLDWSFKDIKLSKPYHGIVMVTDGISDDLVNEELFLKAMLKDLKDKNHRQIKKQLKKELLAWQTPFHTDDKSIGIVLWS